MRKILAKLQSKERGAVNTHSILMMGMAMVFIAVGFIVYPICITGTDAILAYDDTATYNATYVASYYTGLTSVTGIVPLIILLGFISAAVITGFLGMKGVSLSPREYMMLAIGEIFIAVGLIIFPVILSGISSAMYNGGSGLSSSYTGLTTVLRVTPLIILIAFVVGGAVIQFFGTRKAMRKA